MKSNGYLSIMFDWNYTYHFTGDTYTTANYKFW